MTTKNFYSPDLYTQTLNYAANAHSGQTVPGTNLPYIVHIANVAMEVLTTLNIELMRASEATDLATITENDFKPNLAMQCALLHDTIEDTQVTAEEIEKNFGTEVMEGVKALTKDSSLPDKQTQMQDSLNRIKQQPYEIWIVKMADRITNLQPPPQHWTNQKIENYRQEAKLIYNNLKDAYEYLSERLLQKISNYK